MRAVINLKCPKIRQNKNFIKFSEFPMPEQWKLENGRFSAKVEKGGPYRVIRTGY